MRTDRVRWISGLLAALALAQAAAAAQAVGDDCALPSSSRHPLVDRSRMLSSYENLPESCLKALFGACAEAAGTRLLDFDSAAACSLGYEALLRRGFGGDFHAMTDWWRGQRKPIAAR